MKTTDADLKKLEQDEAQRRENDLVDWDRVAEDVIKAQSFMTVLDKWAWRNHGIQYIHSTNEEFGYCIEEFKQMLADAKIPMDFPAFREWLTKFASNPSVVERVMTELRSTEFLTAEEYEENALQYLRSISKPL